MEAGEPKPDRKGRYWCPHLCHDTSYPRPHWKTLKGYLKHLEDKHSQAKYPDAPPRDPVEPCGYCSECDRVVVTGESIWARPRQVIVCWDCLMKNPERRDGWVDCAGLILGGLDDIVA